MRGRHHDGRRSEDDGCCRRNACPARPGPGTRGDSLGRGVAASGEQRRRIGDGGADGSLSPLRRRVRCTRLRTRARWGRRAGGIPVDLASVKHARFARCSNVYRPIKRASSPWRISRDSPTVRSRDSPGSHREPSRDAYASGSPSCGSHSAPSSRGDRPTRSDVLATWGPPHSLESPYGRQGSSSGRCPAAHSRTPPPTSTVVARCGPLRIVRCPSDAAAALTLFPVAPVPHQTQLDRVGWRSWSASYPRWGPVARRARQSAANARVPAGARRARRP